MGMATNLYGCIREYGLQTGGMRNEIYNHNRKIIESLPIHDNFPPLTKNMFAITSNPEPEGIDYEYWGRLIHFGGNFKTIENEWREWRQKFEQLLTRLYWTDAFVHFKAEYTDIQTFNWEIDLNKWSPNRDKVLKPIQREYWDYQGDKAWDE